MKTRFLSLIVAGLALGSSSATPPNSYFLPGDTFFSTTLTEKEIETISSETEPDIPIPLEYARLDDRFQPAGNLGYGSAKLIHVSKEFRLNLHTAFRSFRRPGDARYSKEKKDGQDVFSEINPAVALIYNKGKVSRPLGLKFNEHWKREGDGYYAGFLKDGNAIIKDWQYAADIEPLELANMIDSKRHLMNFGVVHKSMEDPIELDAKKIEVVLVGFLKRKSLVHHSCRGLDHIAKHKPYSSFIRVTDNEIIQHEFDGHGVEKIYKIDQSGEREEIVKPDE